ncbi:hypothetical protein FRUB_08219 [Fimbriiglobus ruber]|uniref:Uncharacterized protein n=1 Tax=Fimbriiglobus ruber TaxID=1908690 RepID=A0A225DE84_9BACT|nr:hypothetical protein FRUB_08219 [Fimbriiglobus ruber]
MTIDQLLDAIDGIRVQKAELEKKEQAMLKILQTKAEKQKQRIEKLTQNAPAKAEAPKEAPVTANQLSIPGIPNESKLPTGTPVLTR